MQTIRFTQPLPANWNLPTVRIVPCGPDEDQDVTVEKLIAQGMLLGGFRDTMNTCDGFRISQMRSGILPGFCSNFVKTSRKWATNILWVIARSAIKSPSSNFGCGARRRNHDTYHFDFPTSSLIVARRATCAVDGWFFTARIPKFVCPPGGSPVSGPFPRDGYPSFWFLLGGTPNQDRDYPQDRCAAWAVCLYTFTQEDFLVAFCFGRCRGLCTSTYIYVQRPWTSCSETLLVGTECWICVDGFSQFFLDALIILGNISSVWRKIS